NLYLSGQSITPDGVRALAKVSPISRAEVDLTNNVVPLDTLGELQSQLPTTVVLTSYSSRVLGQHRLENGILWLSEDTPQGLDDWLGKRHDLQSVKMISARHTGLTPAHASVLANTVELVAVRTID